MTRLLTAALLVAALLGIGAADAADYYKTADGLAVYLGVVPAELVLGHSSEHAEKKMHGGVPRGKAQHHVVIALFDSRNGERITNADVSARVQEIGLGMASKKLEPMAIEKTVSYGNYFAMSASGSYRIDVEIRRQGAPKPVTVRFDYSHPRRGG